MNSKPIFFERNRVFRVYTGGKLFADFFGDEPVDGNYPEEWISSSVIAMNQVMKTPKDGVSIDKETGKYLDDMLKEDPEGMLGSKKTMRVLVKGLDSAIRLPAQAHPDRPFSRKYFNSEFGKTECWTILATRPGARLYFGFKDGVTEEMFNAAIDASETDRDAMERLMEYFEPKIGECYLVPAKTVHAIGYGCLILEIQEPTDFTIQPEHWCGDHHLSDHEMYLGLPKEHASECFIFDKAPDCQMRPKTIKKDDTINYYNLVGPENTECFIINRAEITGGRFDLNIDDSYAVYIVIDGEGVLEGENYSHKLAKGDYFFLPAAAMGKFSISGNLTVVECY